jgi:serine/threonine protein kinase
MKMNPEFVELSSSTKMAWDEVHLLKSLPPHPKLVPFDCVVLEDVESRVIGFTMKYIPGGTLKDLKIPFRFEWIQQLTQLLDFLNIELGIMNQDIAPRNLLNDPDTGRVLLFDFDRAAHGKKCLMDGRDDVLGIVSTIYEIITNDIHFTSMPHWDRTMEMVQGLPSGLVITNLTLTYRSFAAF